MSIKTLLICAFYAGLTLPGNLFGQANTALSNLANPTSVNRSLIPSANNTHSLGNGSRSWKSIYLTGELYLDFARTISGDLAKQNFYVGPYAGKLTATGTRNLGVGFNSLISNTTGYGNVAGGSYSLYLNTTGHENTAFGSESGRYSTGSSNTFIGFKSGFNNSSGTGSTYVGYKAGYNNRGHYSSAFGFQALYSCIAINYNSAFGAYAAYSTTGGGYNAAFGYQSMRSNKTGGFNSVFGANAMYSNTGGSQNAAFGYQAGMTNKGSYNAFFGAYAGSTVQGSNNTFIGYHAAGFVDSVKNSTALGYYTILTASNQVRIGNLDVTSIGGFRPWSNLSDGRFKKDIQENVPGLAFINKLRPVTYTVKLKELDNHLRSLSKDENNYETRATFENENRIMTGFVAQEVEAAAKELNFIFDGVDAPKNEHDLYALRYSEFVVPLVKAVQELYTLNEQKDSIIAEFREALNEIARRDGRALPYNNKTGISQNYPNPVRQSTVIEYTLPDNVGAARLVLTDAAGRMLKNYNLNKSPGGNITLNTGTLASGVYNYSLIVDGKVIQTRKLTVAR